MRQYLQPFIHFLFILFIEQAGWQTTYMTSDKCEREYQNRQKFRKAQLINTTLKYKVVDVRISGDELQTQIISNQIIKQVIIVLLSRIHLHYSIIR